MGCFSGYCSFIYINIGNSIPKHGSVTEGDVIVALKSGHKVRAIKYYRSVHGVSLKEAKDAIEKLTSKT
ncbi:ribosomal protein L7/L12 [Pseudoalteromonas sp. B193]